jgi:hypothetical protein
MNIGASPMLDWVRHIKFYILILCQTQSATSFTNITHDLESVVRVANSVSYVIQAFLFAVVLTNHSF